VVFSKTKKVAHPGKTWLIDAIDADFAATWQMRDQVNQHGY
jgi:hypothetical protein